MNVFEAVKTSINTREAVEHYGIEVNRYGKARCPFHNDRHPSMVSEMVSEVRNCCTYRTVRTAVFNSTANMSIGNEGIFRALKSSLVKTVKFYTVERNRFIIR